MIQVPTVSELCSRAKAFWNFSVTNKFIVLCSLIFIAQTLNLFWSSPLMLNPIWIHERFFLNFLTHGFLHGGFWHLGLNMLAFYFVGNAIERYDFSRNVTVVFLGGIIAGGLVWFALVLGFAGDPKTQTLVGASSGIAALFAYFSIANRGSDIRALIFFLIPVRMRAWLIFVIFLALSLAGLIFFEIPSMDNVSTQSHSTQIAHSAHIGGLLFGAGLVLVSEYFQKKRGNLRYFRR